MFARVYSHAPLGIQGELISVEADLRRGIPGMDIVGLPDKAVKEAKERVRVAIKNSGFEFPPHRILISLSPAGLPKGGAGYDLPIAMAILRASGQLPPDNTTRTMILGELNLTGEVKGVNGVLPAVVTGLKRGVKQFIVPRTNLKEALLPEEGEIFAIKTLKEAADQFTSPRPPSTLKITSPAPAPLPGNLKDIKGQRFLKRALEIAAAGGHHLFLFGPPGCGKTMAARRFPGLLPVLDRNTALEVTGIHSLAGQLSPDVGLINTPPFRSPHHTATREGIIGGGVPTIPGEVSLAHGGVLFLDETGEYSRNLLQSLREPLEEEQVTLARAGRTIRYPACFQLIMASNPCPCGNLGHDKKTCYCSSREIQNYWKRLGGALMDRIDIRVPLKPLAPGELTGKEAQPSTEEIKSRVMKAINRQEERFKALPFSRNSRIPPGLIDQFCPLTENSSKTLTQAVKKLSLSSRAFHSVLKVARSIADLEDSEEIKETHLLEAVQHRRYGDRDFFWNFN